MTTFVLHGGRTSDPLPGNTIFFRHFTDLVEKTEVKILMCYWARQKQEWALKFEQDKVRVLQQTSKQVEFTVVEDPTDLLSKLPTHDVLYVAGGDAPPIEATLPQLSKLKSLLQGKVYLGSSMGAFIVSTHYVLSMDDQDENSVHHGLGLLPINTLCHWNVETKRQQKLELLSN